MVLPALQLHLEILFGPALTPSLRNSHKASKILTELRPYKMGQQYHLYYTDRKSTTTTTSAYSNPTHTPHFYALNASPTFFPIARASVSHKGNTKFFLPKGGHQDLAPNPFAGHCGIIPLRCRCPEFLLVNADMRRHGTVQLGVFFPKLRHLLLRCCCHGDHAGTDTGAECQRCVGKSNRNNLLAFNPSVPAKYSA